ncbi:MAG TPA: HEAT repeat domain-containing protein [Thermoanaerobaculia bacterium]
MRIRLEAPDPTQWVREIQTGDARFDRTFFVEGPVRLVFALLDERTRHLLLQVRSKGRLEISLGELRAVTSARKVPSVLPFLVELCQRFAQPMNVLRRVAENANRDSEEGVRLHNLLLLAHELPGDPVTVEALRTACSDPGTEIRLRAAKELGAEGRPILLEFAESRADDALSAGAVLILDRELPFERARAILDDALRNRRLQTARACLEVLGRSRATEAVETLAKVMLEEEGELAAAAALALETTRSPEAEPPLILALRREPKDLQVAAANVLGRIGSAEAVLPLKELADRSPRNSELLQATRQAVAEIQSRLPGASPGQLSLAAAEVGQLSLAQAEAGQLSIATDAGGQLSLPTVESGQLLLGEDGEESVQKD